MRTIGLLLLLVALVTGGVFAEETNPPFVSFESVMASLPTQSERERWRSYPEETRQSPTEAELAQKIKNASKNCQQLQSLIIVGKSPSDYPGLLTLGTLLWDKNNKGYILVVKIPMRRFEGDYGGFQCRFNQVWKIVGVSESIYVF